MRRFLVPGTVLLFLLLGASIGLAECAQLLRVCISKANDFKLVRPASIDWIDGIQPLGQFLESMDGPFRALSVAVILLLIAAIAALLDPTFRLLKPPEENPGRGAGAHLDLNRLWRGLPWVLVTLWWMGVLAPLSLILPRRTMVSVLGYLFLGGIPVWTAFLPPLFHSLLQSILTGGLLWLTWSEGGLASQARRRPLHRTLFEGALAGAAMAPSFLLFREVPAWALNAGRAYGLAEKDGWYALAWATTLGPTLGMLVMGVILVLFRRRPEQTSLPRFAPILAILGALVTVGGDVPVLRSLDALDAGHPSLARRLSLPGYELTRFAYVAKPDGSIDLGIVPDGSAAEEGWDRIACTGETVSAVQDFLERRQWRSQLGFRAWMHLHACASIDWLKSRNLDLAMQLSEHAPSPIGMQRLLDMLENCPSSLENRKYLDQLADPQRFHWLTQEGTRWLGMAYLRFGDAEKARSLLMNAGLKPEEFRTALTGVTPIADGKVTGRLTVEGEPLEGLRLGLVRLEHAGRMVGMQAPYEWRAVLSSAYTKKDGSFAFDDIPEGRYALVMTGGPVGRTPGKPKLTPPGEILVDRFHARADLKSLDLHYAPLPPPEAQPPPYAPPQQERT